jgi:CubicO group peptidase (beta-lactamase class C family)
MFSPFRRDQLDATFGHIVDFGLGVILNSNRHGADTVPYGFGTKAGDRAFGHGGARSSMAFADPDHGFTAAVFLNGRVPETEHQPRMRTILDQLRSELVSG